MKRSPLARKTPLRSSRPTGVLAQASFQRVRSKRCAVCRESFEPARPGMRVCGAVCSEAFAAALRAKAERKADKARKEAIEPLEYWLKRAEKACNAYIRKRDEGQGCISCGRHNAEVWNAGHFISVGGNRSLRYHEDNIHLQCARPCNKDKGGNIHEYRKGLLAKIGHERLAWLDGWHEPVKMTREKAQEIEAFYKGKLRLLQQGRSYEVMQTKQEIEP